jgi:hypothetical protein
VKCLEDRTLPSFLTPLQFPSGSNPQWTVAAHFNGDGKMDLAVVNQGDPATGLGGSLSILLGNGNGTFRAPITYAAGTRPTVVRVGDFNGDGKPDLLVQDKVSNLQPGNDYEGRVFLGNGDGTLQPGIDLSGSVGIGAIFKVGDFNGDGKDDIALLGLNGPSPSIVSIWLSNGDGTFHGGVVGGDTQDPAAMVLGDFNGDGKLDIAVANHDAMTVDVLLGNGDGTTPNGVSTSTVSNPAFMAVGDFNGDGKLDLAVAYTDGRLALMLGNGDGSFQAPTFIKSVSDVQAMTIGDFNNDGKEDLAVLTGDGVSVLLGNGDGTFMSPVHYVAATTVAQLVAADFNGDHRADLAAINGDGVTVLASNSDGTLRAPLEYPAPYIPGILAVGDFNGDGHPDLVTDLGGNFNVLLNNGAGTFRQVNTITSFISSALAVGDFNGDGKQDLVVVNNGLGTGNAGVFDFLGKGNGKFAATATGFDFYPVGADLTSVAVGDFNGDGKLDVVLTDYTDNQVGIVLGNGDGTFQPPINYPTDAQPVAVAVGDFNHDGNADLAVVTGNGVDIFLGNGDGTFQPPVLYGAGASPTAVAVGDFNGDGKQDLAVTSFNGVGVLLGKGDGTFQPVVEYKAGLGPVSVAVADFNGDGKQDLAVGNDSSFSILLGNGNGTFQAPQSYTAPTGFAYVAAADFNGDGAPDLAVANDSAVSSNAGGAITIFRNDPATHLRIQVSSASPTAGQAIKVTVTALDAAGLPVPDYQGTVHFTSTDAQASLPADYTFTAKDHGKHGFKVTLQTAGKQTITVVDSFRSTVVGKARVTVQPAVAPLAGLAPRAAPFGQGTDAGGLTGPQRADQRQQTLGWLEADLAALHRRLEKEREGARLAVLRSLWRWQRGASSAGRRGLEELTRLSAAERADWQEYWEEVVAPRAAGLE